jgi:hypothetical protein
MGSRQNLVALYSARRDGKRFARRKTTMRVLSITAVCTLFLATAASADSPAPPAAAPTPDPADCWVELYDEPTLEGDKVRLEGPLSQPELARLDYANGENLNDDVRGVKTGPTARVELYDKADFGGYVYRIYNDSSETLDKSNIGEEASSLRITCIDNLPPVSAPNPADCWVELYDEPTLEGDKVRLQGPISQPKLAKIDYPNGENLNDDVRGVKTGPTAQVTLFDKADFKGQSYRVFPGSSDSISAKGFGEEASSIKVTCAQ